MNLCFSRVGMINKKDSLVDIIDSSSSAPGYFPSVLMKNNKYYIDGSIGCSYPTDCAYAEALSLWPDDDIRVLSIGTGICKSDIGIKPSNWWGILPWAFQGKFLNLLYDSNRSVVNDRMNIFSKSLGHKYYHVNGLIDSLHFSMDDVSPDNIKFLKQLGDQWWNEHKDKIMELIL